MKITKILLTLMFLLLLGPLTMAADLTATTSTFATVYSGASDGDVILLDAGTYTSAVTFPSGKTLTIKGNPALASKPVLNFALSAPTGINGSLIFDNVTIDRGGAGNDFFAPGKITSTNSGWSIAFKNSILTNMKALINIGTQGSDAINAITIENCIVKAINTGSSTNFMYLYLPVSAITIKNSTFFNVNTSDLIKNTTSAATSVIALKVYNNTFYNSLNSVRAIWSDANTGSGYATGSTFDFVNNLLDKSNSTGRTYSIYSRKGSGQTLNQLNLVHSGLTWNTTSAEYNWGEYWTVGANTTATVPNLTTFFGSTTPFPDAANGNFYLGSTSPAATGGYNATLNGVAYSNQIGDPRWLTTPALSFSSGTTVTGIDYNKNTGTPTVKTFTVAATVPGSAVTITAPTHYLVSTSENSGFVSSLTLGTGGFDLPTQTIYVKMVSDVVAGTSYPENIIVSAANITSQTVSLSGDATGLTSLATPTGLSSSNIIAGGFTANWTAVSNAVSYTIEVYNSSGTKVKEQTTGDASSTNTNITGISAGKYFNFKVRANGDGTNYNNSLLSDVSTGFTTLTKSATTSTLSTVFDNSLDGDVILLDAGTYSTALTFPTAKDITLKANPSASSKPEFTFQLGAPTGAGGSLILDGISINRGGDYFISSSDTYSLDTLSFKNCTIKNINKSLIYTSAAGGSLSVFTIDNCFITSSGSGSTPFIEVNHSIGSFTIKNSTVASFVGGDFFHATTANANSTIAVLFDHNNFYKTISNSGYAICGLAGSGYAANSTFQFFDNIFDQGANAALPRISYIRVGGGAVTQTNNLLVDYQGDYLTGISATRNNLTLNSGSLTGITAIPYTNAAVGNFTIPTTSLVTTKGVANGTSYIGDPEWVNVITNPANITTAASIAEAGTVSPASLTVNVGDVVTVSTTLNFGYDFVNWTDGNNNVISTSREFQYTTTGDKSLTANFTAYNTYTLDLSNSNGAPSYMVNITPSGTMVNGSRKYREGTKVTLTAYDNTAFKLKNWSNGESSNSIHFAMTADKSLTAEYAVADYLAVWDFYASGGVARPVDKASSNNSAKTLILRKADGTTNSWLDKSNVATSTKYGEAVGSGKIWKAVADLYYFQTEINATGYKDIQVAADFSYDYNTYTTRICQYSLDGTNFTALGSYTMPDTKTWYSKSFTLPVEADNAASVTLRWIADANSSVNGTVAANNDGTSIANVFITGTPISTDDATAPVLSSSVPAASATNASINGKVTLTFDERIKVSSSNVKGTLNGKQIQPTVIGNTLVFPYTYLIYNQQYTFTLPTGSVTDIFGNTLNSEISVAFTTMQRPVVRKRNFDFVVGANGSLSAALSAASTASSNGERYYIFFPNGEYNIGATGDANQMTTVTLPNVSYVGQNADKVVLYNQNTSEGMGNTATLNFTSAATNLYLQDLSIKNMDYRSGITSIGRCLALYDDGTKNIYKNVNVLSNQDTYFSGSGRKYFEGGQIHGTVDYIFGGGDIFFNGVNLFMEGDGYVTAANTSSSTNWGYVFSGCTIDGVNGVSYSLGRPWQNSPKTVFINTTMKKAPVAEGWSEWYATPSKYAEYNSVDANSNPIDLTSRRTTYGSTVLSPVLTAEQAGTYTLENVLGSSDGWNPSIYTAQATTPVISGTGNSISWSDDNYTLCWAVFKDGVFVQTTTSPAYTIPAKISGGAYTVRAANEMGGLGASSNSYAYLSSQASYYFRSKANGDADDVSSWEISSDNISWTDAAVVPSANGNVSIMDGHAITITTDLVVAGLTLNSGAVLNVSPDKQLTVVTSMTNNGTINLNSDAAGTATILTPASIGGSGTANVKQYLSASRNWYVSSPVNGATVPESGYTFYSRDESLQTGTNGWVTMLAGATLTKGQGYVLNNSVSPSTITFSGALNTGNVSIIISRTAGVDHEGYNLVGNPYPSYINWDNSSITGIQSSVWQRAKNRSGSYVFDTYNKSGLVGIDNSGMGTNGNIAPMQAFWVKVADGQTQATINFTNAMRAHRASKTILTGYVSDARFKVKSSENILPTVIRLQLSNGLNSDELLVYTNSEAQNTADGYDSPKMLNNNAAIPDIYTVVDGQKMAINGLNSIVANTEIPVGFVSSSTKEFTFKALQVVNNLSEIKIVLKDKWTGSEVELTETSTYTFNSEAVNTQDRFAIVFKSTALTTDEIENNFNSQVSISDNGNKQIRIDNNTEDALQISVYTMAGLKVISDNLSGATKTLNQKLQSGLYVVEINNGVQNSTQKVLIK